MSLCLLKVSIQVSLNKSIKLLIYLNTISFQNWCLPTIVRSMSILARNFLQRQSRNFSSATSLLKKIQQLNPCPLNTMLDARTLVRYLPVLNVWSIDSEAYFFTMIVVNLME